jgi:regulator of replication initiation timing
MNKTEIFQKMEDVKQAIFQEACKIDAAEKEIKKLNAKMRRLSVELQRLRK